MTGPGNKFDHLLKGMISKVDSQGYRVKTQESRMEDTGARKTRETAGASSLESRVKILDSVFESLDDTALGKAIEEANKKPKLGVYSPLAAAMLRYKAITIPRYSMGAELREVIEQALKEAYPQLYEEVQRRMK